MYQRSPICIKHKRFLTSSAILFLVRLVGPSSAAPLIGALCAKLWFCSSTSEAFSLQYARVTLNTAIVMLPQCNWQLSHAPARGGALNCCQFQKNARTES